MPHAGPGLDLDLVPCRYVFDALQPGLGQGRADGLRKRWVWKRRSLRAQPVVRVVVTWSGHVAFPGLTGAGTPGSGGSGAGGAAGRISAEPDAGVELESGILAPRVLLGLLAIVMGAFMAYSPSVRTQFIGLARGSRRQISSGLGKLGTRLSSWVSGAVGGKR